MRRWPDPCRSPSVGCACACGPVASFWGCDHRGNSIQNGSALTASSGRAPLVVTVYQGPANCRTCKKGQCLGAAGIGPWSWAEAISRRLELFFASLFLPAESAGAACLPPPWGACPSGHLFRQLPVEVPLWSPLRPAGVDPRLSSVGHGPLPWVCYPPANWRGFFPWQAGKSARLRLYESRAAPQLYHHLNLPLLHALVVVAAESVHRFPPSWWLDTQRGTRWEF